MELRELRASELKGAGDVLAHAYADDPEFRGCFQLGGRGLLARLRPLFQYAFLTHLLGGFPVMGVFIDRILVGAVNVHPPDALVVPSAVRRIELRLRYLQMTALLGKRPRVLMGAYTRSAEAHRPEAPHHLITQLGILPDVQGLGCGRALISHVFEQAERHPRSQGVFLCTYSDLKSAIYQRWGFKVLHHGVAGDIAYWSLHRSNPAPAPLPWPGPRALG